MDQKKIALSLLLSLAAGEANSQTTLRSEERINESLMVIDVMNARNKYIVTFPIQHEREALEALAEKNLLVLHKVNIKSEVVSNSEESSLIQKYLTQIFGEEAVSVISIDDMILSSNEGHGFGKFL
jgi:hypothetical protein